MESTWPDRAERKFHLKALIVYASKTGATEDVARTMAKRIGKNCALYDCRRKVFTPVKPWMNEVAADLDLQAYDLVVIGTPMYMGKPMKEIAKFCAEQEGALARKKLAFFTLGIGTAQVDKDYLWKCLPGKLLATQPAHYHMGGEIREERLNPLERLAMREYNKKAAEKPSIDLKEIVMACEAFTRYLETEKEALPCKGA